MSKPTGSALVPINGRPLFVEIAGSGPPLVSLHGLGGATILFPIARDFGDFTVIQFDFEGAGHSPLASERLTMAGFVEDVRAVLEYAGFAGEKAVVYGHSMGAAVALHFAATHPSLPSHLILSCPSLPRPNTPEATAACAFLSNQALTVGPFTMAANTAAKNLAPSPHPLARALVRAAVQLSSAEGYVKSCELIRDAPAPQWEAVVAPVLIIAGTEDLISSVQAAEAVKDLLVQAESVTVEPVEAGHQPAVEVPEVVARLVHDFCGGMKGVKAQPRQNAA